MLTFKLHISRLDLHVTDVIRESASPHVLALRFYYAFLMTVGTDRM